MKRLGGVFRSFPIIVLYPGLAVILILSYQILWRSVSYMRKSEEFAQIDHKDKLITELTRPTAISEPTRAMILTTWRSGSTFLGDILLSHPGTFYHYEPFLHLGIKQVRGGQLATQVIKEIKQMLKCDFSKLDRMFHYGIRHKEVFSHNLPIWQHCKNPQQFHLCLNPDYLERTCKLHPYQSLKTVRVRANLTEDLLKDKKLKLKILLLVRDPRGTMQSRQHRTWCPNNPDCSDPNLLCQDLVSDFYAAKHLMQQYPDSFSVVRYEDVSLDPYENSKKILNFFNFAMSPEVEEFIKSHTKVNVGGVSSTFRNSKTAPFHWKQDLTFAQISNIQDKCKTAMTLWGYRTFYRPGDLKTNSLLSISDIKTL